MSKKIAEKQADLGKLYKELETAQEKMEQGGLTDADAKDYSAKAKEALALQSEVDQYHEIARLASKGREIPDPVTPSAKRADADQGQGGFVTIGEKVVSSEAYRQFIARGAPMENVALGGSTELLSHGKYARMSAAEIKAVPTLGSGTIEPMRLAEIVRATEFDQLTLRDVLNVSPTSSPTITYVRVDSYTRAADTVADSSPKPEAALVTSLQTANVRTHAVTIPVTEQMLQDAPAVMNEVNQHLLYDLNKEEEEQVFYGGGTGQDFGGFFTGTNISAARSAAGDTLIDVVRRAITDVKSSGFMPNALVVHPMDWEQIELEKGSDERYVWAVIRDALGPRIWGLRVVESVSTEETALATNPERNLIVGDFARGATLYVREAVNIAVGFVNAQFTSNQRTIRAETRSAFALKRPLAFRKHLTHTASGTS